MADFASNSARAGTLLEPLAGVTTRVLSVDDDEYARLLIERYLVKRGYEVVLAESARRAKEILMANEENYFSCVITDYMMPEETGAGLIRWMREHFPSIAAIVVTAVGEKGIVAQMLRSGACNFLDKPVRALDLVAAVEDAVVQTGKRRELAKTDADAREVGRIQKRLLRKQGGAVVDGIRISYHALRGAGGDFSVCYPVSKDQMLVLAADVSGHDLRSAFISAYFQGVLRGMLENAVTIPTILDYFNYFLVNEWADAEEAFASDTTSLAVCAVLVDRASLDVQIFNQGFPSGALIGPDGLEYKDVLGGGYPLGWIHPTEINCHKIQASRGSFVLLWTDGVEDQANRLGVTLWALLTVLLRHHEEAGRPEYLLSANDDVMVIRVPVSVSDGAPAEEVIMRESYRGSDYGEIDRFQKCWGRSLRLVYPDVSEERLEEVAICLREVVLNGMLHGCQKAVDKVCSLVVTDVVSEQLVRVRFDDPGEGHSFDVEAHLSRMEDALIDQHRGLMFLRHLSTRFEARRNCASVLMDFSLKPA